jgi:hypothetical protein
MGWEGTAMKDGLGGGTFPKTCSLELQTICLNTSLPSFSHGLTFLLAAYVILSMRDSTTAEGWLKKSYFTELGECPIQASV